VYNYDTRQIISILQLWLTQSNDNSEYIEFPYLFAHIMGFYNVLDIMEFMDILKGCSEKVKRLCIQYYHDHINNKQDMTMDIEAISNMIETASFADAYIGLTHKQRHQVIIKIII
jgi:uncharacterized protein YkvS